MSTREQSKFDILGKIEKERIKRGWTEYMLAQNSNLPQSTISTWYRKKLQPSVASIERICNGLGITLAQFFADEDEPAVSKDQKELFEYWQKMNPAQRESLISFLKNM